jgi:hypothetical protein
VKRRNERQESVTVKLDILLKKLNALREKFFLLLKFINFINIGLEKYLKPLKIDEKIREKEIHETL